MKFTLDKIRIIFILSIILSVGVPRTSDVKTTNIVIIQNNTSANAGVVTGVPYVWQEINGFCMWAAVSMAMRYARASLGLYDLFAVSGIGFSASYLRYEDNLLFAPGAFYRQLASLDRASSLYGLNTTMYMDASIELGMAYQEFGANYTSLNGWDGAFSFLKQTIESGYPLVLWTDPYYLPHEDYETVRELGLTSDISGGGHAVVVVGYNDTSETAQIMDPGIGAFGDNFGYPSQGSWSYDINYTSLRNTWSAQAYGAFLLKPGTGKVDDFTIQLATYIVDRLRGDRFAYLPETEEDVFFWNFGADAFRGMAYDLTAEGLSTLMDDVEISDPEIEALVLSSIGLQYEGFLSLQYLSYRSAIKVLPSLLLDLTLDEFVRVGQEAFPYFEEICDNSTMIEFDYLGGATIMTDTLCSIAYSCENTTSGDVHAAVTEHDDDLNHIRENLMKIADVWDAAADALERALQGDGTLTLALVSSSIGGLVILAVVFIRRRSSI
jgi:hypothetical protein